MTENTFGEFKKWGSTPRFHKGLHITEKIDGTNGGVSVQIVSIADLAMVPQDAKAVLDSSGDFGYWVRAQSRKRIITPENDNYGFAKWVWDNAEALANILGMGYHYGEWYGEGIQNNPLAVKGRYWALFNTWHWGRPENALKLSLSGVEGLTHVPVLHDESRDGPATWATIPALLSGLRLLGSVADGYMSHPLAHKMDYSVRGPEGIIVWHKETQQKYKILLENDAIHKGEQ